MNSLNNELLLELINLVFPTDLILMCLPIVYYAMVEIRELQLKVINLLLNCFRAACGSIRLWLL